MEMSTRLGFLRELKKGSRTMVCLSKKLAKNVVESMTT